MFGLGRKKPGAHGAGTPGVSAAAEALKRSIDARRASEPLLASQIAGKELFSRAAALLKDARGVHVESLATALGALAGHASQLAALQGRQAGIPEYAARTLHIVDVADGRRFYFGDAINYPLIESKYSVWGLVAGYAQQAGATLPDLAELAGHSASTIGGPQSGIPRYEPGTSAGDSPVGYLSLWPVFHPVVQTLEPDPQRWPVAYGLAVQELFALARPDFDLGILTRIVMDSAIATSKNIAAA